jgi:hypothetical protein
MIPSTGPPFRNLLLRLYSDLPVAAITSVGAYIHETFAKVDIPAMMKKREHFLKILRYGSSANSLCKLIPSYDKSILPPC